MTEIFLGVKQFIRLIFFCLYGVLLDYNFAVISKADVSRGEKGD